MLACRSFRRHPVGEEHAARVSPRALTTPTTMLVPAPIISEKLQSLAHSARGILSYRLHLPTSFTRPRPITVTAAPPPTTTFKSSLPLPTLVLHIFSPNPISIHLQAHALCPSPSFFVLRLPPTLLSNHSHALLPSSFPRPRCSSFYFSLPNPTLLHFPLPNVLAR